MLVNKRGVKAIQALRDDLDDLKEFTGCTVGRFEIKDGINQIVLEGGKEDFFLEEGDFLLKTKKGIRILTEHEFDDYPSDWIKLMSFHEAMTPLEYGVGIRRQCWADHVYLHNPGPGKERYFIDEKGQVVMSQSVLNIVGPDCPEGKIYLITDEDLKAKDWEVSLEDIEKDFETISKNMGSM